jgi:hypothetical protein
MKLNIIQKCEMAKRRTLEIVKYKLSKSPNRSAEDEFERVLNNF